VLVEAFDEVGIVKGIGHQNTFQAVRNGRTPADRPLRPSTGVLSIARWEGFEPPAA
jgi:hypothetical protein